MWKARLSESGFAKAIVDRTWDGWTFAEGLFGPWERPGCRWWQIGGVGQLTLIGQELSGQPMFLQGITHPLTFKTTLNPLRSPQVPPALAGRC